MMVWKVETEEIMGKILKTCAFHPKSGIQQLRAVYLLKTNPIYYKILHSMSLAQRMLSRLIARTSRTVRGSYGRAFSTTPTWQIRSVDMKETDLQTLKVNQRRMMDTLHHTCTFGTGHRWGQ
jgi:hypothetical protein